MDSFSIPHWLSWQAGLWDPGIQSQQVEKRLWWAGWQGSGEGGNTEEQRLFGPCFGGSRSSFMPHSKGGTLDLLYLGPSKALSETHLSNPPGSRSPGGSVQTLATHLGPKLVWEISNYRSSETPQWAEMHLQPAWHLAVPGSAVGTGLSPSPLLAICSCPAGRCSNPTHSPFLRLKRVFQI